MDSHFAEAKRADLSELSESIALAGANLVIDGVMKSVGGMIAVINRYRQIIALNDLLLAEMGIDDPEEVLGLRLGEAIRCIHADEMPAGCGTSRYCSTCGAAIAIVTSLSTEKPVERKCVATVSGNGRIRELCLCVRSSPITVEGHRFLLIFLQDITDQEKWAALDRTFHHDIRNLINGVSGASEIMKYSGEKDTEDHVRRLCRLSSMLAREVDIQRALARSELDDYRLEHEEVSVEQIVSELTALFIAHPVSGNRRLNIVEPLPDAVFQTDVPLLVRVLSNMLANAFEATEEGGEVRLQCFREPHQVTFTVWNEAAIPEDHGKRIFQKHFTTKPEPGRGIGTYAMKLLAEQFLGGEVSFMSSEQDGTTFRLSVPV